jgi:predicted molibdopterin-dependent oxidoreductase YjgC
MKEIAALTPIYAGVSYENLERGDVLMWPVYSYADSGSPILFGTTFPVGKGKFVAVGWGWSADGKRISGWRTPSR